jgi:hypothetical protein
VPVFLLPSRSLIFCCRPLQLQSNLFHGFQLSVYKKRDKYQGG